MVKHLNNQHPRPPPRAPSHLEPGIFQGGAHVPLGLVRGEGERGCNPGCHPPGKLKLCWGRGRNPSPSLPDRAGGWGDDQDRVATSATPRLAEPRHVPAIPLSPPPRGPVFRRFLGVAPGAKEAAWPWPSSRDPWCSNAAASPYSRLPIPLSSTLSPPLASPYGFSMAAAAWIAHCAGARVRSAWGRGKELQRQREGAAERMRPQAPLLPRLALGARAVVGAEAGAARKSLASAAPPSLLAASPGAGGRPHLLPLRQV